MSHGDENRPTWETELSFERQAASDGDEQNASAWEQELARWSDPESSETPPPEPVDAPAAPTIPPVPPTPVVPAPSAAPNGLDWLTQPLEETAEPAPPAPVEAPPDEQIAPVIPLSLPAPLEDLPEVPEPTVDPPAALVELPTAVLPPEPEAAEPPAPETAPKVPFYKREISLGRKKSEPKPKAERKRRERPDRKPKTKTNKEPEPVSEEAAAAAKAPFYRRELSLKRTKTASVPKTRPERAPKRPKLQRPALTRPELGTGKNAKRLVGLKIGASQIAAARVANSDSPQLLQAVSAPLEPGIVVGGELRDPEALAAALREFFKQHNLPRKGIRLGIANNRIGVRTLEIVGIDDPKLLDNAVKFRAQEVLPIPIEDAVLDYQVLSESVEDGQPSRRVLLVVAYRDLVDRYVEACRQAGLQLVGIDLEAFALLRALSEPKSELQPLPGTERAALVAVAVGHDRSTFAISDGRTCEFTRVLGWGGWSLNVAIARALDTSPSEAEAVKRSISFEGNDTPPPGFTADQLATAREAARGQLQSFARELVSSLQFYQNQPGSLGIGEIVVTGGTSHLVGLAAELERMVGVPVRIGDPLARVKTGKGLGELEQVGSLAVAIGLGIED